MQEEGLLTPQHEVVVGRARRVYEITGLGLAVLVKQRAALAELAREVIGHPEGQ